MSMSLAPTNLSEVQRILEQKQAELLQELRLWDGILKRQLKRRPPELARCMERTGPAPKRRLL